MKKATIAVLLLCLIACNEKKKAATIISDEDIKIKVLFYIDSISRGTDLAIANYRLAYQMEGRQSVDFVNDLEIVKDSTGRSAESSFLIVNSADSYKRIKGSKVQTTGISFKVDSTGKVLSHAGFLLYYPSPSFYFNMETGTDQLFNHMNK
ncbi:MAG TPA: hypothetical protein VK541_11350 [Pedobacter sp.]|uniref:hypothetical protein n=1 Tax=Pedobacter sp. TaxID=1411316 RepID=UPI002BB17735|nr:hypothetical protein [Pedobacter sp.]HMI03071.1 hypothetical protein [Pedobacter sp.]